MNLTIFQKQLPAPTNLMISFARDNQHLAITWDETRTPNKNLVKGIKKVYYNIYKGHSQNGLFMKINENPIPFNRFEDKHVNINPNIMNWYKVSSLYLDENNNYIEGFEAAGELIDLIDSNYEQAIEKALLLIPDKIKKLIAGKEYKIDDMGKSGSTILIFDDCVLKILASRLHNEESSVEVLNWLKEKIPVPEVLAFEKNGDYQYLLMTRISGVMSCSEYYMEHPKELLPLLAQAFKMLWSVDISGCPKTRDFDSELKAARYRVENNLVDIDDAEPDTFGKNGFENPETLLKWLEENIPAYEPVLSHGDFCLPNVLLKDGKVSGFIDCGDTAIGDKWKDIALCYRSLKHNFDGTFGGKVYPDFNPDLFFDALGIEADWEKIRHWILLDELF